MSDNLVGLGVAGLIGYYVLGPLFMLIFGAIYISVMWFFGFKAFLWVFFTTPIWVGLLVYFIIELSKEW
jgi:hypothetical protein